MSYWKAHPHQWGPGRTHLLAPDGTKTLCGKKLADCPGQHIPEVEYDCRACAQARLTQERWRQSDERQRQWEEQRAEENRRWWEAYTAYLQTPEWFEKRQRVLERAQGRCEGCGERAALQVHHRRYPQACSPGSYEWRAQEKLFDLAAVCARCHDDIHGLRF